MTEQVDLLAIEREVLEQEAEDLAKFKSGSGEAPVIYRSIAGAVSKANDGPIEFVASHESDDRMGDIIRQDGWELSSFKKNPVMLWSHDSRSAPPIGVWKNVRVEKKSLLAIANFDEEDPFAALIEGKVRRGILNAVSVGFRPLEFEFRDEEKDAKEEKFFFRPPADFKKSELLEISIVAVPAHPKALRKALQIAHDGTPGAKKYIFLPGENFGTFEARAVEPEPDPATSGDDALLAAINRLSDQISAMPNSSVLIPVDSSVMSTSGFITTLTQPKAPPVSDEPEPDPTPDVDPDLIPDADDGTNPIEQLEAVASGMRELVSAFEGKKSND